MRRLSAYGCRDKYFGLNKSAVFGSITGGMKSHIESVFAEDPPAVVLGELEVATVSGEDLHRAALLLEEEH